MASFVHRVRLVQGSEVEGELEVQARTQVDDRHPASAVRYQMTVTLKPGETSWDGLVRAAKAIVAQEEWIRTRMAGF